MQSPRQNWLATGQCSVRSCNFCIVETIVSIIVIKSYKLIERFIQESYLSSCAYRLDNSSGQGNHSLRTTIKKKNHGLAQD